MNNPYLFPGLEIGPPAIRELIRGIDPREYDVATHAGRFTPREVIAHLADWEGIHLERMKKAYEQSGCEVIGIDEGDLAVQNQYAIKDPLVEADRYVALRKQCVEWLRSLKPEDWGKTMRHNEKGEMTIYDHANMMVGHDMYHVEQLAAACVPKTAGTW